MSTLTEASVRDLIASELPSLIDLRRDLHRHPELCFQEHRTARVVQRELDALGIQFIAGLGSDGSGPGTGVIGYLPATQPTHGRGAVALRADLDALPITEQTGRDYASQTPGVMHACGHDGHTTILIGAARVLTKLPRPRPVLLVFQPAEEGGGGADKMCKQGILDGEGKGGLGAPVDTMFGLHAWPTREVGHVATKPGPLLAATDDFEVTIRGAQAHGAYPHFGHDPILAAAHVITALQSIASRSVSPLDAVVVTVGAINAGTADNIIPETCRFIGTVRTLLPRTRVLARERFFAIVEQAALALGCHAQIAWKPGYPVTVNDPAATRTFFEIAAAALGPDRVETVDLPTMGGEDFSYYAHRVPACFFFLGIKPAGAESYPTLHQPDFDFNDDAIPTGVEVFCELARRA